MKKAIYIVIAGDGSDWHMLDGSIVRGITVEQLKELLNGDIDISETTPVVKDVKLTTNLGEGGILCRV